jgi:hypothetical protein
LGGGHGHEDDQELLQQYDEMEEQLTQPVKTVGGFGHTQWSPRSKSGSVISDMSQTFSTYSGDVAAGRSSTFQSSSVSSSYLGSARGIGNYDKNIEASPSWLSDASDTHPYTSPSWRTYGSSGGDAFGQSRYRTTLSGT